VRKLTTTVLFALVLGTCAAVFAAPAGAQEGGPGPGSVISGCAITVEPSPLPGLTVTVNGTGFDLTEVLPLAVNGTVVQEVTTDAAGTFTAQVDIPADATAPVVITVPCSPGSTEVASATGSDPAAALAFTGSDSSPLVIGALFAIGVGAVLVVGARRRSSAQAHRVNA
jgi:predicted naringenin-chalcone synthase